MMKFVITLFITTLSFTLLAGTNSVITTVKKFRLDADQKHYRVILKGKQITYKAEEKDLPCLESSLESQKDVKLVIDGNMITDCKKI